MEIKPRDNPKAYATRNVCTHCRSSSPCGAGSCRSRTGLSIPAVKTFLHSCGYLIAVNSGISSVPIQMTEGVGRCVRWIDGAGSQRGGSLAPPCPAVPVPPWSSSACRPGARLAKQPLVLASLQENGLWANFRLDYWVDQRAVLLHDSYKGWTKEGAEVLGQKWGAAWDPPFWQ